MVTIKKGNSSINVVFKGNQQYTNKLSARNIMLNGGTVEIDYSHYEKKKRGNLEDTDFEKLQKSSNQISHIIVADETVKNKLKNETITTVVIKIDKKTIVNLKVSGFDEISGFIK
jgi:CRISPR/Cas system CMR subunit Cmr4 (Cas7 group RAMP superfamily)